MNKPIKKLNLSRETIRNLQPDELAGAAGGGVATLVCPISSVVSITVTLSLLCPPKPE